MFSGSIVVCIEGNIGAGKSTLLDALQRTYGYRVIKEPVEAWTEALTRFYADPRRWAFLLQCQIQHSMARMAATARAMGGVVLLERSPAGAGVFVAQLRAMGYLDGLEAHVYDTLGEGGWEADMVIHLATPADVCVERMRRRARAAEAPVEPGYVEELGRRYACIDCDASIGDRGTETVAQLARAVHLCVQERVADVADAPR